MKKHFKTIIFGLVAALMIPTSAFAADDTVSPLGAGEWDPLGWDYDLKVYHFKFDESEEFSSGGGNLEVCFYGVTSGNKFTIDVFDRDPGIGNDDRVPNGTRGISYNGQCQVFDVSPSSITDGDNGKAEIYVKVGYGELDMGEELVDMRVRD